MSDSYPLSSVAPASVREFNTTHWSVVLLAGNRQSPQSADALEKLCRTYWPPLYAFIRRKGCSEEDAQDLTQEFFTRLLRKEDFDTVHPRKGKFRTFLLTALNHFLSNERDRARAAKRGGGRQIISLEEITSNPTHRFEPACDLSPDKLFDLHWAMTVLEQALIKLREEMIAAGKDSQFAQLKTYLTDEPTEGEYAIVAPRLGMTNQTLAVTVHRLRRRYRELVRAEVTQTVATSGELEDELRHLFHALNL